MRSRSIRIVESKPFQIFIMAVIAVNAITIGIETLPLSSEAHAAFAAFDTFCLVIYIIEIILKLIAYRGMFFKDGWNDFDFVIVAVCLVPAGIIPIPVQVARVFRILRVFRVFRLVSAFRQMRIIVEAVGKSIPGVFWTAFLLIIIYYVFAIIGTSLFGEAFPEWFGDLGASFYTLFQVMTLESWSMGISRPVMEVFPWAWAYFVPFVIASAFIIVNVVVGIIVGTIDETNKSMRMEEAEAGEDTLEKELDALREQIERVQTMIDVQKGVDKASLHVNPAGASAEHANDLSDEPAGQGGF